MFFHTIFFFLFLFINHTQTNTYKQNSYFGGRNLETPSFIP